MGIGNVKVVFEPALSGIAAVEHGNALGATVYPPPEPPVPAILALNGKHGGGIRPLRKQQNLLLEWQTEIAAGGGQKGLPLVRR
ncbi:MAG: hypothetical protein ACI3V4_12855 [Faecousia sp.]